VIDMQSDQDSAMETKGFWMSLRGIATGVAGVATAVATILGVLRFQGRPDPAPYQPPTAVVDATHTTSDAGPTRAAWALQANAVCKEIDAQIPALGPPQSAEEWITEVSILSDSIKVADRRLRVLTAPAEDVMAIQSMTSFWDAGAQHLDMALQAFQAGEIISGQNAVQSFSDPSARGNQIANELGASACADMGSSLRF